MCNPITRGGQANSDYSFSNQRCKAVDVWKLAYRYFTGNFESYTNMLPCSQNQKSLHGAYSLSCVSVGMWSIP